MNTIFKKGYVFHLLYVLVYIGFLLMEKQWLSLNNDWNSYYPTFLVRLSLMLLLVYLNTFILIPLLFEKKKTAAYVVSVLALILVYTMIKSLYDHYLFKKLFDVKDQDISNYFWDSSLYAVWFTIVSSMLYIIQKWYEQKQQVKNIQISQLESELKFLRAQINPHFLFNGLNTIYGNIDLSNEKARNILVQFTDLLRYNLYEAEVKLVEIEKEISYIQNYVSLQQARSDKNLDVEIVINIKDRYRKIAPLLFIPFIENAFKYVGRESEQKNFIKIEFEQAGERLLFSCINTYDDQEEKSGGIGLANVKRRLDLIYGEKYDLKLLREINLFIVKLTLSI